MSDRNRKRLPAKTVREATSSTPRAPREHSFLSKIGVGQKPPYYHCLFFGPSRSGKTTLVGTAGSYAETSPHLMLDFEGGSNSVMGLPGVAVARIRDWDDFSEAYDYLSNSNHEFRSVSVDSISELHVFTVLDIIARDSANSDRRSDDMAEIQDYGKAMIMLRRFLLRMKKLEMHVMITALTKTETFPREGRVQVPFMFGQMAGEVVGAFPIVGYLLNDTIEEPRRDKNSRHDRSREKQYQRNLYINNQEGMRVGIRAPLSTKMVDVLPNPTIEKLFEVVDRAYAQGDSNG